MLALCVGEAGVRQGHYFFREPPFPKTFSTSLQDRPSVLFIDSDSDAVDAVRATRLFSPRRCISGKEDASGVFARGYYSDIGKHLLPEAFDAIRLRVEGEEGSCGFLFFHSEGGGTGSGFQSLLMTELKDEFRRPIHTVSCIPSPKWPGTSTEFYNSSLWMDSSECCCDCETRLLVDNEALYKLTEKLGIRDPGFADLNSIHSFSLHSIDFSTMINLVPFADKNAICQSLAPIYSPEVAAFQTNTFSQLAKDVWSNSTCSCNPLDGELFGAVMAFQGAKEHETAIPKALQGMKVQFLPSSPTGWKCSFEEQVEQRSESLVATWSGTSIRKVYETIDDKFTKMIKKNAFVHWYTTEGMEISEFHDAHESMQDLIQSYRALEHPLKPPLETAPPSPLEISMPMVVAHRKLKPKPATPEPPKAGTMIIA